MNNATNYHYYNYISWKYNTQKDIETETVKPSDLKESILTAFLIVLSASFLLNSFNNKLSNSPKTNSLYTETTEQKESAQANPNNIFNFLKTKEASAATLNTYEAKPQKNTHHETFNQNETKVYTIKIQNTGLNTWKKGKVSLETGPFLRSFSKFKSPSWNKFYQIAKLTKDTPPGKTATFKLPLTNNQTSGEFQENFQLVHNFYPITGSEIRFFITIKTPTITQPISIQQTNTISKITTNTNNTISTPTVSTKTITPITNTTDNKKICAASVNTNFPNLFDHDPCQTSPKENDQTNGAIEIKKTTQSSIEENIKFNQEPIIRIGLFNTKDAQRITASSHYDVYAGNLLILSGLSPNYISTLSFNENTKTYAVSTSGTTKFSIFPIRFVPRDQNGVITLLDFSKSPKWNTSLNDNKFRNTIEFNYSNTTKKLWLINELPMSDYLKGLSETSNYSPVEYQKVVATAARSYAMYHYNRGINIGNTKASTKHQAENYHLDATWDQVYRGYNSEIRLTKLQEAVDQTKGMIVTYNNNIIVTPYFSQSDGRTRSWEEVWYGDPKPWLKSVSVPRESNKDMWGHGVGMSARGALYMTRDENVNWKDTLKYFYQNTEIQKIYQ